MDKKSYNIKLDYIKATDTVKQVCIKRTNVDDPNDVSRAVYLLNQDKDDDYFNWNYEDNKTGFKLSVEEQGFMHNMYSTKDMFYKSAIYDKGKSNRTGTTYDFKNIFSHNLEEPYKDVAHIENTLYASTALSPYGHIDISCDSYQYLAQDNGNIKLHNVEIETCLYNRDAVNKVVNGDDDARISTVAKTFTGIPYNTMLEIPGNILNENDSGNMAANAFKGKNQYNSIYDMQHTHSSSNCLSNNLLHTRSYTKIDNCNNQLYFKYYDNLSCISASVETPATTSGDSYIPAKQELSAIASNNQLYNDVKIQNIETIDYITRYVNRYGHKSSLYSIVVDTDNKLFNNESFMPNVSEDDPQAKLNRRHSMEMLKNNIKSFVKNITKKLMPVNTQLFEVVIK